GSTLTPRSGLTEEAPDALASGASSLQGAITRPRLRLFLLRAGVLRAPRARRRRARIPKPGGPALIGGTVVLARQLLEGEHNRRLLWIAFGHLVLLPRLLELRLFGFGERPRSHQVVVALLAGPLVGLGHGLRHGEVLAEVGA